LPPLYTLGDDLAVGLMASGLETDDPLWRLPLHMPYESMLSSKVADINNAGQGGFAGSITAALFLRRFVKKAKDWAHLDIFAWAPEARAGRPFGGTEQGIRAVYGYLKQRYS
jgi:leucyl aminopeptidase